jgi:hypothetical protein
LVHRAYASDITCVGPISISDISCIGCAACNDGGTDYCDTSVLLVYIFGSNISARCAGCDTGELVVHTRASKFANLCCANFCNGGETDFCDALSSGLFSSSCCCTCRTSPVDRSADCPEA